MKLISEKSKLAGEILIPASKSHTIRAVALATMAEGESILRNPLDSSDARSAFRAAAEFGATIIEEDGLWRIKGVGKHISPTASFIDVGNSGTTLRIFSALAGLGSRYITFDGDKSIRKRPMTPLLNALRNLGARVKAYQNRCPLAISGPLEGGETTVDGISSQFLTALLFASPLATDDTIITVENLHEKPYVEITLDWLRLQNIKFEQKGLDWFKIKGNQSYTPFDRMIPADFSSATFAICAAAVTQSELLIRGLDFGDHQGDKAVFEYLERMGMLIRHEVNGVRVIGQKLKGITIDMNATPDALPAMAVLSCFAEGTTKLFNVKQARLKECDRISGIATELKKMGANIQEMEDGLIIHKSDLKGTEVHGYDDHRMVMALAIAGMAASGKTIVDTAEAISVTYPTFVESMSAIGADIKSF